MASKSDNNFSKNRDGRSPRSRQTKDTDHLSAIGQLSGKKSHESTPKKPIGHGNVVTRNTSKAPTRNTSPRILRNRSVAVHPLPRAQPRRTLSGVAPDSRNSHSNRRQTGQSKDPGVSTQVPSAQRSHAGSPNSSSSLRSKSSPKLSNLTGYDARQRWPSPASPETPKLGSRGGILSSVSTNTLTNRGRPVKKSTSSSDGHLDTRRSSSPVIFFFSRDGSESNLWSMKDNVADSIETSEDDLPKSTVHTRSQQSLSPSPLAHGGYRRRDSDIARNIAHVPAEVGSSGCTPVRELPMTPAVKRKTDLFRSPVLQKSVSSKKDKGNRKPVAAKALFAPATNTAPSNFLGANKKTTKDARKSFGTTTRGVQKKTTRASRSSVVLRSAATSTTIRTALRSSSGGGRLTATSATGGTTSKTSSATRPKRTSSSRQSEVKKRRLSADLKLAAVVSHKAKMAFASTGAATGIRSDKDSDTDSMALRQIRLTDLFTDVDSGISLPDSKLVSLIVKKKTSQNDTPTVSTRTSRRLLKDTKMI